MSSASYKSAGFMRTLSVFTEPYRLEVGHHVEDDKVVKEIEEGWNRPLHVAEERGARGAAQIFVRSALYGKATGTNTQSLRVSPRHNQQEGKWVLNNKQYRL